MSTTLKRVPRVKKLKNEPIGSTLQRQSRVLKGVRRSYGLNRLGTQPKLISGPSRFMQSSESLESLDGTSIPLKGGHAAKPLTTMQKIGLKTQTVLTRRAVQRVQQMDEQLAVVRQMSGKPKPSGFIVRTQAKASNAIAQLTLVAETIRGAYESFRNDQEGIKKLIESEDHFEDHTNLQTRVDPTNGFITKYEIIPQPPPVELYSVSQFLKDVKKPTNFNIFTGQYHVPSSYLDRLDKDYHWTYSKKQLGNDWVGMFKVYDREDPYFFYYNKDAVQPKGGELIRYLGIPTIVNNEQKIEWFRYSLHADSYQTDFNTSGIRLQRAYTADWNDGFTRLKPLGLTLEQWFAKYGQNAEKAQELNNQEEMNVGDMQTIIDHLMVYLNTTAVDAPSVYQYLQSLITPDWTEQTFQEVWNSYNNWRTDHGLLAVSSDDIDKGTVVQAVEELKTESTNTPTGSGELVVPTSSLFGPLYREQNIKFEHQFQ